MRLLSLAAGTGGGTVSELESDASVKSKGTGATLALVSPSISSTIELMLLSCFDTFNNAFFVLPLKRLRKLLL